MTKHTSLFGVVPWIGIKLIRNLLFGDIFWFLVDQQFVFLLERIYEKILYFFAFNSM